MRTLACADERIDGERFDANVAQLARRLRDAGVGPGSRVALLLSNALAFLELTVAVGRLGAYPVPVNWHFAGPEVAALLQDATPRLIFADDDLAALVPNALAGITILSSGYAAWRDRPARPLGATLAAPGSIIYTSGTTGRPKGVERSAPTPEQAAAVKAIRKHQFAIDGAARVLVPGPLYHAFPNQMAVLAVGDAAHVEIMPRFDAEEVLRLIESERITSIGLAPIMFVRLLRLAPEVRASYDLSSLRWAIHAGGPCPLDVKRAMIDWWGPVIAEYYGGTETGPLTLATSAEWLERPGTCGRPMEGVMLRIVAADRSDVAVGERGEIFGRLACYPPFTYRNDPAKRAEVALGDLVSLGDIGYQDADGYLFLCDRARDMIISGGVNIYPAEIETALFALDGVQDCAVFGVPDPEFGESVAACVVGDTVDVAAIPQLLRGRIASYKIPRRIFVVDTIGRDPSGKVRKAQLRERFARPTTR